MQTGIIPNDQALAQSEGVPWSDPALNTKFRRANCCKRELFFAMNPLAGRRDPRSSFAARSAKGWTPERRALQAQRIRLSQPWRRSTGPKTNAGKARVAMNPLRHGYRSRAWHLRARRIRHAIRLCANTLLLARVFMRQPTNIVIPGACDAHEARAGTHG